MPHFGCPNPVKERNQLEEWDFSVISIIFRNEKELGGTQILAELRFATLLDSLAAEDCTSPHVWEGAGNTRRK